MRISTLWYCVRQGFHSIRKNKLFSLASVGTMAICIFLFCIFYAMVTNVQFMVRNLENTVGVTVFFDEGISEEEIFAIGDAIGAREGVAGLNYISAEEAWETYQKDYFHEAPELAEGFAKDNPLANCASYEIYLEDLADQDEFVEYLKNVDGIRRVNYSKIAADGLSGINNLVGYVSMGIILILLAVAVFLISNTIAIGISVRKEEIAIMRLIGAKNSFIKAPFLIEGIIIGLVGACIPLGILYYLYNRMILYIAEKFGILTNVLNFIQVNELFRTLVPVGMALGVGIGFFGSIFTTQRHLKV